jgi:hypothetical protein
MANTQGEREGNTPSLLLGKEFAQQVHRSVEYLKNKKNNAKKEVSTPARPECIAKPDEADSFRQAQRAYRRVREIKKGPEISGPFPIFLSFFSITLGFLCSKKLRVGKKLVYYF